MADFLGVREGTRVIASPPNPLSKYGEGAYSLGAGEDQGGEYIPIESLQTGYLVFTHRNRYMPVLQVFKHEYEGEMLEIRFQGIAASLFITPEHWIATPAESLPNFKGRVGMARALRKESTPAESKLWSLVRGKRYGVKVRRQHPMGPFVLDFYIPDVRLAIEVDGSIHELEQQKEYDRFREEMIQNHDIEFLRFTNNEIHTKTSMVLLTIADRINARKTQFDYRVHWRTAGVLKVGRVVLAAGMAEQRIITFIGKIQTRETVYNLSVAEDHTYVTEFCTLHNCGG